MCASDTYVGRPTYIHPQRTTFGLCRNNDNNNNNNNNNSATIVNTCVTVCVDVSCLPQMYVLWYNNAMGLFWTRLLDLSDINK